MKFKRSTFLGLALTSLLVGGCTFTSSVSPDTTGKSDNKDQQSGAVNPIIQAIAPNPTAVATKSDVMTFTVNAYAPDGAVLDYTWSATKGYLSSTKGQVVSWTPQKADGSLEAGIGSIQVLITNGKGGSAQASVNIRIAEDGSAAKQ